MLNQTNDYFKRFPVNDINVFSNIFPEFRYAYVRKGESTPEFLAVTMKLCVDITTPLYTCLRPPGAAGALLISHGHVIIGYVAPPENTMTCKDHDRCDMENGHCVRTIHAEQRAIFEAAKRGIITKDGIIFSILKPCYQCTKAIIQAGIKQIYYAGFAYDEFRTNELLRETYTGYEFVDIGLEYGGLKK